MKERFKLYKIDYTGHEIFLFVKDLSNGEKEFLYFALGLFEHRHIPDDWETPIGERGSQRWNSIP